ncbi:hypothetical protein [Paraferrimonas haliotis]|uniref:Anti-sigma factor n=1 Tax=Paraferrimonas haliotis TaxID=2013866 RepID=A0AA37WVX3_9GAMM|nr:hypothetical protein [Paraferrimonas haliotis]GLS82908.1 anti-sigma factor [Paraferrimonas haliotis]
MNESKAALQNAINDMPNQLQPQTDLWPAIERQLVTGAVQPEPQRSNTAWRNIAIAASLALVSVLSFVGGQHMSKPDNSQSLALLHLLEQQHQQQLAMQTRVGFSAKLTASDNATALSQGINEVRQGAKTVLAQLQQDPNNLELLQLWLWLQQRELELVNQAQSSAFNRI